MSYYRQFNQFNPLTQNPPRVPYPAMNDITERARRLLKGIDVKQLTEIAEVVDWIIDGTVALALESAEADGAPEPSRDDRSDAQWLQDRIFLFDVGSNPDSSFPGYHQCFAVLALWKIVDAHFALQPELDVRVIQPSCLVDAPVAHQWAVTANYTIDAMEAVCCAEQLQIVHCGEQLSKIFGLPPGDAAMASTGDPIREQISIRARKAAIRKHADDYAARSRVIELYKTRNYRSVESAAQAIAPLVFKAPRTVAKWIYDQRKGRTPLLPALVE